MRESEVFISLLVSAEEPELRVTDRSGSCLPAPTRHSVLQIAHRQHLAVYCSQTPALLSMQSSCTPNFCTLVSVFVTGVTMSTTGRYPRSSLVAGSFSRAETQSCCGAPSFPRYPQGVTAAAGMRAQPRRTASKHPPHTHTSETVLSGLA